jgi:hypothetical protein
MKKKDYHKLSGVHTDRIVVYGLLCQEAHYRLCWEINQKLGLHLSISQNITRFLKKHTITQDFSQFIDRDANTLGWVKLVANKSSIGVFVNEYRHIDYFLIIPDNLETDYELLKSSLNEIDLIGGVFVLDMFMLNEFTELWQMS